MGVPPKNTSQNSTVEERRTHVSRLRLRGYTQWEIVKALPKMGVLNSKGEPWSIATINRDIKAVRQEWRNQYAKTFDEHVSNVLAEIKEVRREAWCTQDYELVLKCCDRECKLLGLDKPGKLIVDWREEAKAAGVNAGDIFESIVAEFAESITASD